MIDRILETYNDTEFLKADGFDDAIIGVSARDVPVLIYSMSKCIKILQEEMSPEDASEFFHFNVLGAYLGERTPIFMDDSF